MKTLLLLLVIGPCLFGQTTSITGPLRDASGALTNCFISVTLKSFGSASPAIIGYAAIAGDLTGASGGYGGSLQRVAFNSAFHLFPGLYSATISCRDQPGSHTYVWKVPIGGTISIAALNQKAGTGRTWAEMTQFNWAATPGAWADQ